MRQINEPLPIAFMAIKLQDFKEICYTLNHIMVNQTALQ